MDKWMVLQLFEIIAIVDFCFILYFCIDRKKKNKPIKNNSSKPQKNKQNEKDIINCNFACHLWSKSIPRPVFEKVERTCHGKNPGNGYQ